MPTIHVAHSPDSDDAFMFWALASGRIETDDREYIHELADIETLNHRALKAELEVTAVQPVALELAPEVEEDWGE